MCAQQMFTEKQRFLPMIILKIKEFKKWFDISFILYDTATDD